jgi:hypothetical protein
MSKKQFFTPRYINIAAITETAGPVSTQCWCASQDDLAEADQVLLAKWITPSEEKWHGKIVAGSIYDLHTHVLRNYVRQDGKLVELSTMVIGD